MPAPLPKLPVKMWLFRSGSDRDKLYQTLLYNDGSLSCDCPGWTRRNPSSGRTCKHVRAVAGGEGMALAYGGRMVSFKDEGSNRRAGVIVRTADEPSSEKDRTFRLVDFKEESY